MLSKLNVKKDKHRSSLLLVSVIHILPTFTNMTRWIRFPWVSRILAAAVILYLYCIPIFVTVILNLKQGYTALYKYQI